MNTIKLNTIGEAPAKKVGGSQYKYYDVRGVSKDNLQFVLAYFPIGRFLNGVFTVSTGFVAANEGIVQALSAVAVDLSFEYIIEGSPVTGEEMMESAMSVVGSLPEITKEEFYDPNWGNVSPA